MKISSVWNSVLGLTGVVLAAGLLGLGQYSPTGNGGLIQNNPNTRSQGGSAELWKQIPFLLKSVYEL